MMRCGIAQQIYIGLSRICLMPPHMPVKMWSGWHMEWHAIKLNLVES
jgi:hypothetical protein